MTLLSKSAILCANDLQTEDVNVPERGGDVRVRSFTGRERDAMVIYGIEPSSANRLNCQH